MNHAITLYHEPLASLSYIFGFNSLSLADQPDQRMESSYYLYGYQKYMGFSFNLMGILIATGYGVAISILAVSAFMPAGTAKILKKLTFVVTNDLCYSLIVFSTPNIVTGLCI